jgi:hypothetical protein
VSQPQADAFLLQPQIVIFTGYDLPAGHGRGCTRFLPTATRSSGRLERAHRGMWHSQGGEIAYPAPVDRLRLPDVHSGAAPYRHAAEPVVRAL